MGTINAPEKKVANSFMRILVAEEDDIAAFVLQCELSKLEQPYSFNRVSDPDDYLKELTRFCPSLVIASAKMLTPSLIAETRQRVPSARLIIVGCDSDTEVAEQALKYGATDCLFTSQLSEIRLCLQQKPLPRKTNLLELARTRGGYLRATQEWLKAAWQDTLLLWESTSTKTRRLFSGEALRQARKPNHAQGWYGLKQFWTGAKGWWQKEETAPTKGISAQGISTENPRHPGSPRHVRGELGNFPRLGQTVAGANGAGLDQSLDEMTDELYQQIAAREEAESALEVSDLSFRTLFESSLDAILLLDNEGAILQANSAAAIVFSSPLSTLIDRKVIEFVAGSQQPMFETEWKGFVQQGFWRGEIRFELPGSPWRDMQFCARANVWCGVHLFIARDVSEHKHLRRELEQLRTALIKSLEAQAVQRRLLNELEQRLNWFASSAANLSKAG